jgi:UDP-N-acetylmuramate dehydrogenase
MSQLNESQITELSEFLRNAGIAFQRNVDLTQFTYMKTGGVAQTIAFPQGTAEVSAIAKYLHEKALRYKIIGNTSNLLFLDDTNYSILVSTVRMSTVTYDPAHEMFVVESGAMLSDVSRRALLESVTGYEGLEGIPGTLGGGVFMNAGAYGDELKDILISGELVQPNGKIKMVSGPEFKLAHRTSILRKENNGSIVCKLFLRAKKGDASKIYRKMELVHAKRHRYQDFMYPNLGSIYSGSPYRALSEKDLLFKFISAAYYLFCYKLKFLPCESPINRRWINRIAMKRFNLRYKVQPFSDKTLNCLVNRGQGTAEMIKYIRDLEQLTAGTIPIENEIVENF